MFKHILILITLSLSLQAQTPNDHYPHQGDSARPWTFWYWMHGAVSKPGIKADLEAMKEVGLGGFYLFPIRGVDGTDYPDAVNQLTPAWWEMVRYSMQIADSLDLKMGMHISDGFALAGGPWIKPAESMQKVVFTDTIIKGGKIKKLKLRQPETFQDYYEDIAVYAFPVDKALSAQSLNPDKNKPVITSNLPDFPSPFSEKGVDFRSEKPCYIQYSFDKPFLLRTLEITPAGNNFQSQRLSVMASEDGLKFRLITQTEPPRHGWQNTGFNNTFSIPPTVARYFRLNWTPAGTEPGSEDLDAAKWKPTLKIKAIRLGSEARINLWEGKSGLVWRIGKETSFKEISNEDCIAADKIIRLTAFFKNGELNCQLPRGNWRILRMGHTSTGQTNATGGGGKGLECDKFSETAVQKQFDNWFEAVFEKTDNELAHRVLKYMHIDSWECGSQNWSSRFSTEFKQRRGYDLMPWLPLLAGYPIESAAKSEQVLRDVRTTIAELVNDVFFRVFVKNAKASGCETSAESVAPTMVSDGLLHYGEVDIPMGEFWFRSPTHDKPNDMLDAISGAHIYGKNIIQSESFTQLRTLWDEHPAMLKTLLDRNFALGINKLFFHVFVHNPYLNQSPGTTLSGMGLYFQRDQTWWKQSRAFVDYITRCQVLLQRGVPVTDIAVYTGEEIPQRAYTPEKLVPFLPGIIGKSRVENELKRLKNTGQPMREMPYGVNNSANIFDISGWINPLQGYAYDSFNKDALMRLAKTSDGQMSLPGGASYQVVVFPHPEQYSSATREKISELKKAGVIVPDLPVTTEDFSSAGVEPDILVPDGIAWTHRRDGETDIYFISNQEDYSREMDVSFRVSGKSPFCWYPLDGSVVNPTWNEENNRTSAQFALPPSGSVFVIFEKVVSTSVFDVKPTEILSSVTELTAKWDIHFTNNDIKMTSDTLFDWSKHADSSISNYSGTTIYKTTFFTDNISDRILLDLGKVYNLATVRVNGEDCGTLWTSPFQTDISGAVKKGLNKLEIEVTNTWANAIKASDKGIPPFAGIKTNGQYRRQEEILLEAGLLGPLHIFFMK
jgi:hypothetical protein